MAFLNLFGDAWLVYMSRKSSDHFPMMISLVRERRVVVRPFGFQRMWGSHENFLPLVKEVWSGRLEGCPMVHVSKILKMMKGALRKWNFEVFGRVDVEI